MRINEIVSKTYKNLNQFYKSNKDAISLTVFGAAGMMGGAVGVGYSIIKSNNLISSIGVGVTSGLILVIGTFSCSIGMHMIADNTKIVERCFGYVSKKILPRQRTKKIGKIEPITHYIKPKPKYNLRKIVNDYYKLDNRNPYIKV